jgi:hypothetical protein
MMDDEKIIMALISKFHSLIFLFPFNMDIFLLPPLYRKNVAKGYSEVQVKVREATSNDPWGPSGSLMAEISEYTYNQ